MPSASTSCSEADIWQRQSTEQRESSQAASEILFVGPELAFYAYLFSGPLKFHVCFGDIECPLSLSLGPCGIRAVTGQVYCQSCLGGTSHLCHSFMIFSAKFWTSKLDQVVSRHLVSKLLVFCLGLQGSHSIG